jgi:hypothetical protein
MHPIDLALARLAASTTALFTLAAAKKPCLGRWTEKQSLIECHSTARPVSMTRRKQTRTNPSSAPQGNKSAPFPNHATIIDGHLREYTYEQSTNENRMGSMDRMGRMRTALQCSMHYAAGQHRQKYNALERRRPEQVV